jgi:hypothetical protein
MSGTGDHRRLAATAVGAVLVIVLAGAGGCNRHDDSASDASTRPAGPAAVASVAATRPTTRPAATLTVDSRPLSFPAARLVVTRKADGVDVVLCSDDPPTAIQYNYAGNSFYFEMRLDVDDVSNLPGAVWIDKVPDRQAQDTPNGIFLNGARWQLQPADVRISFERRGEQLLANLSGRFVAVDSHDPAAVPRSLNVDGSLVAVVQEQ